MVLLTIQYKRSGFEISLYVKSSLRWKWCPLCFKLNWTPREIFSMKRHCSFFFEKSGKNILLVSSGNISAKILFIHSCIHKTQLLSFKCWPIIYSLKMFYKQIVDGSLTLLLLYCCFTSSLLSVLFTCSDFCCVVCQLFF